MFSLFDDDFDSAQSILPFDGEVYYFGKIFDTVQSETYFLKLLNEIAWENDKNIIFGKTIITKRKVAWYGEKPFEYTYSNTTKTALYWTNELLEIKKTVEKLTNETYNSCLMNLYHNGQEGMSWHSDAEKQLKKNGAIASVSFGISRKFAFKHKLNHEKIALQLENGSLLVMKGETQQHWLHKLPTTTKITTARINLTFRTIK